MTKKKDKTVKDNIVKEQSGVDRAPKPQPAPFVRWGKSLQYQLSARSSDREQEIREAVAGRQIPLPLGDAVSPREIDPRWWSLASVDEWRVLAAVVGALSDTLYKGNVFGEHRQILIDTLETKGLPKIESDVPILGLHPADLCRLCKAKRIKNGKDYHPEERKNLVAALVNLGSRSEIVYATDKREIDGKVQEFTILTHCKPFTVYLVYDTAFAPQDMELVSKDPTYKQGRLVSIYIILDNLFYMGVERNFLLKHADYVERLRAASKTKIAKPTLRLWEFFLREVNATKTSLPDNNKRAWKYETLIRVSGLDRQKEKDRRMRGLQTALETYKEAGYIRGWKKTKGRLGESMLEIEFNREEVKPGQP